MDAAGPGAEDAEHLKPGYADGDGEVDGAGHAYPGRGEEWGERVGDQGGIVAG